MNKLPETRILFCSASDNRRKGPSNLGQVQLKAGLWVDFKDEWYWLTFKFLKMQIFAKSLEKTLNILIAFLTASSTKVRGNVNLSIHLETLEKEADENGLSESHLEDVMDVIASARHGKSYSI